MEVIKRLICHLSRKTIRKQHNLSEAIVSRNALFFNNGISKFRTKKGLISYDLIIKFSTLKIIFEDIFISPKSIMKLTINSLKKLTQKTPESTIFTINLKSILVGMYSVRITVLSNQKLILDVVYLLKVHNIPIMCDFTRSK